MPSAETEEARIDKWMRDIAPSTTLRKWFNHEPDKWDQFRQKYHDELNKSAALNELLLYLEEHKIVTLLFAAREEKYNHAIVLQQFVNNHLHS
jgi:uncharacterized protein YeaO (DUF488 family)